MSNMTPSGKSGECPDLSVFCRWSRCMASTKWTVSFIVRCLRWSSSFLIVVRLAGVQKLLI